MKKAKDIMTPNPFCLKKSDTVQYAAVQFRSRKIDGAPVVDEEGKVVGIFTKGYLMDVIARNLPYTTPVSQMMKTEVVTAATDTPIQDILFTKVGRMPIVDEEGHIVGIITRSNLLDAFHCETEHSRDKLEVILESLYNAIIAIDSTGIITTWNRAAERITGIKAAEAINRHVMDVIPNTGLLEILETGQCVSGKKIKFGSTVAITNRSPIIKDGKANGAVAVLQDISDLEAIASELKASQSLNKELDAIIDSVYEGLYITDGEGYTTRINKSYTRITGIKEEEVVGWHMKDLVDRGYYSQSVTLIVLERKQPVTIIHTIKGSKRCMITGNPVFNENGEIICVVTTVRDITELINLKEKLEETEELTRRYHLELEHLRQQQLEQAEIVGQSKELQLVLETALQASQVDATVLLLGETGVGKDVIALRIHKQSPRKNGPFIKVNCAAIPESLLESELFGYEKGAFTGAQNKGKPGMFELAHTGTILLDEVGDLPLSLQVKLLRVIQEKELTRIGGTQPQKLDLRIIAATNQDLERLVKKGLFREDLYYRLNVIPIYIPPLRMRREDIALLAKHYLDYYNRKYNRQKTLSHSALETLNQHTWPGNVRELKNLLERIVVIINDDLITRDHLRSITQKVEQQDYLSGLQNNLQLGEAVAQVEKELISQALLSEKSTRGAASVLGVSQPTIVRKARKYGIVLWDDTKTNHR